MGGNSGKRRGSAQSGIHRGEENATLVAGSCLLQWKVSTLLFGKSFVSSFWISFVELDCCLLKIGVDLRSNSSKHNGP